MAPIERAAAPPARHRPLRYFFPSMAALAAVVLALVFVPEFQRFAAGTSDSLPIDSAVPSNYYRVIRLR